MFCEKSTAISETREPERSNGESFESERERERVWWWVVMEIPEGREDEEMRESRVPHYRLLSD